jgi:hypothetical protein
MRCWKGGWAFEDEKGALPKQHVSLQCRRFGLRCRADIPMYDTIKIFRTGRSHMAVLTRVNRPPGATAASTIDDEECLAGGSVHGPLARCESSYVGLSRRTPSTYPLPHQQMEAQVGLCRPGSLGPTSRFPGFPLYGWWAVIVTVTVVRVSQG